ncbi:Neprilysin-1 [Orchesella cincta]|uniref:Neprilysin-1 n=1 Tax=Orchesella cincta TaxID=48709 RepID=A0A1D2MHD1_ORCCI|nr:Neprilysin-1 [Orchesella cincta]
MSYRHFYDFESLNIHTQVWLHPVLFQRSGNLIQISVLSSELLRGKSSSFTTLFVAILTGATWSKRHSRRQSPTLEEWQQRSLEKLQVLAREGGLPEEEWKGITKFDKDVCYEKNCLDAVALEFMTSVNFTVDPCNKNTWLDFACSRRVNGNDNINQVERLMMNTDGQTIDILEASTETGSLKNEFLLKEAQTYYFQCKNKARDDKEDIKGIYKFLSENYGNWPIFTNRVPNEKFDWSDMVADLNRMERFGFTPLVFQVLIPTAEMGLGQTSFNSVNGADFVAFFKGIHKNAELKKPFRQEQINEMLVFLNKLNAVSLQQSSAVKATVAQIQKRTDEVFAEKNLQSNINFEKFFKQIFANSEIPISAETEVLPFDTVLAVLYHLATSDQRAVSNALNFQYASLLLQESTTLLDDLNTFKCTEEPGAREQICLERTKEIFGYSLGKTFLKVYLDEPTITPIVSDLMKKIQKGYINVVLGYDWMANSTKAYLKDKIESMRTFITQPDWLRRKMPLKISMKR